MQQSSHVQKRLFIPSSPTSGSYNLFASSSAMVLEFGRDCDIDVRFVVEHSTDSYSALYLVVSSCINYHPQHQETSLVRPESCMDLWIYRYSFKRAL